MKCEEQGHQVNGSNGNWEAKRQEMGVLNLLGMGEKGARNPRRQEEGGSALGYRSGDLHSRGGRHLPATEDMRSEPRELGLGIEDAGYAKTGSTHALGPLGVSPRPALLTGCPSRGFRPAAATSFVAPQAAETTVPDAVQAATHPPRHLPPQDPGEQPRAVAVGAGKAHQWKMEPRPPVTGAKPSCLWTWATSGPRSAGPGLGARVTYFQVLPDHS